MFHSEVHDQLDQTAEASSPRWPGDARRRWSRKLCWTKDRVGPQVSGGPGGLMGLHGDVPDTSWRSFVGHPWPDELGGLRPIANGPIRKFSNAITCLNSFLMWRPHRMSVAGPFQSESPTGEVRLKVKKNRGNTCTHVNQKHEIQNTNAQFAGVCDNCETGFKHEQMVISWGSISKKSWTIGSWPSKLDRNSSFTINTGISWKTMDLAMNNGDYDRNMARNASNPIPLVWTTNPPSKDVSKWLNYSPYAQYEAQVTFVWGTGFRLGLARLVTCICCHTWRETDMERCCGPSASLLMGVGFQWPTSIKSNYTWCVYIYIIYLYAKII